MYKLNSPTPIRSQPWPHRYGSRRWRLVPVIPHQAALYLELPRAATCNHDKIARWLKRWPNADWMVVTGLISRLVCPDVDFRPEGNGRNTLEFDLEIGFRRGRLVAHSPLAVGIRLLLRGRIMRWRHPSPLGSFLDIEGDRGQIILPPARGRFGTRISVTI